jgi:hypothetical protein
MISTGRVAERIYPIIIAITEEVVSAVIVASNANPGRRYCALKHIVVSVVLSPNSIDRIKPRDSRKVRIGIWFQETNVVREVGFEPTNSYESGYLIVTPFFRQS